MQYRYTALMCSLSFAFSVGATMDARANEQQELAAYYGVQDPAYYQDQSGAGYYDQLVPHQSAIPREIVEWSGNERPNSIVISTSQRRLYYILPNHQAISYGVGVGRPGFEWSGVKSVVAKKEWPDWRPPSQMLARRPDLPRYMPGGIENPLGARAMYLGGSLYRIHGSNEPDTIGQAVSSGCIRMTNEDVTDLYSRVRIGTRVAVYR